MTWTAEMDAFLRNAHGVLSFGEIGRKLGVSRGSVCGRAWRMGLPRISTAPKKRYYEPKKWKPEIVKPKPVVEKPVVEFVPLNISFVALEPFHCREVVGSEGFGRALYCGHQIIHESSFCRWHHSINYTKAERKAYPVAA